MTDRPQPARVSLIVRYAAAILVISALSALQMPYRYGGGNHVFQLPTVHRLINPDLYPGDALVDSLRNYPSEAYPAIAWLARTLSVQVEPLYLVLWLVERVWLVGMFMLIAARFVADYWGRVFVSLVASTTGWALLTTLIGGEHLFSAHLTHTDLAFALQLAALAAWLHGRPMASGVATAGALYLNAMTTVHFVGFMVLLVVFSGAWRSRSALLAGVSFIVPAVPFGIRLGGIVFGPGGGTSPSELYWRLQFALPNHHLLMDVWDPPALLVLATVTITVGWLSRRKTPLGALALAGAVYSATMLVVSLFGGHLFPSRLVQMFHPLRGDKPIHLALVIATPVFLWLQAGDRGISRSARFVLPVLAAVFILGPRPPVPVLFALPALILLYAMLAGLRPGGSERRVMVAALLGLAAVALAVALLPGATILAVAAMVGIAAALAAHRAATPRWALLAAVTLVALGQVARESTDVRAARLEWYRPGPDRDFNEMAHWADVSTDVSARFITPPYLEGWRCLGRRGTLVQYRDGSAMDWCAGFEHGWWSRLDALGCQLWPDAPNLHDQLRERYLALTPGELVAAAVRYDIDYVIMPAAWHAPPGVAPVHTTGDYRAWAVADLRGALSDRGRE